MYPGLFVYLAHFTWQFSTSLSQQQFSPDRSPVYLAHSTCSVCATLELTTSMGRSVSYRSGACRKMPAVPITQAPVNIHRNSRSKTIATYFHSSFTYHKQREKGISSFKMQKSRKVKKKKKFFLCGTLEFPSGGKISYVTRRSSKSYHQMTKRFCSYQMEQIIFLAVQKICSIWTEHMTFCTLYDDLCYHENAHW